MKQSRTLKVSALTTINKQHRKYRQNIERRAPPIPVPTRPTSLPKSLARPPRCALWAWNGKRAMHRPFLASDGVGSPRPLCATYFGHDDYIMTFSIQIGIWVSWYTWHFLGAMAGDYHVPCGLLTSVILGAGERCGEGGRAVGRM